MARYPGPLGTDTNPGLIDPGTCARTHHRPPGPVCSTRPTETEIAYRRALAAQKHQVRLVIWGGAATPGDNSAFEFAARNVVGDYRAKTKGNFSFVQQHIKVAKDIVTAIKRQGHDSIRSLDIFTHGGPHALYLTTAEADSGADNIAADLSIRLYQAGKRDAYVIGHADKANPNIKGGGEKNAEQDYRHGRRIVFHNGRIIRATSQNGFIDENALGGLAAGDKP